MLKHTTPGNVPATKRRRPKRTKNTEEGRIESARKLVLKSWAAIIQGLIGKALDGGYQHTKLLLELCGFTATDAKEITGVKKQQLCDALLKDLNVYSKGVDPSEGEHGQKEREPRPQDGNEKHTEQ
ncbi:MAG: hypothetical protein ACP5EP_03705 [Acidobacteriaceae bacterium]